MAIRCISILQSSNDSHLVQWPLDYWRCNLWWTTWANAPSCTWKHWILVEATFEAVLASSGLRFIAGDFNFVAIEERNGDVQPAFCGQSVQCAQWFRQLRRLQCYLRFRQKNASDQSQAHGTQLWRSILCAKGFPSGFQVWWEVGCKTHLIGTPASCPLIAPSVSVAKAMYESFTIEVRHLEQSLLHQSKARAKKLREEQALLVFKDVKKPSPDKVELLLTAQKVKIESVCADDSCVFLSRPVCFDSSKPCFIHGKQFEVVDGTADRLYLANVEGVQPGQFVSQSNYLGRADEMFQAFEQEWSARWNRHTDIPSSQWDQIVAFARQTLPKIHSNCPPFTMDMLQTEIRRKKKTSATGLDGVSLDDLKQMPPAAQQAHCDLLNSIEACGKWPQQLLEGRVASLAKTVTPQSVQEFRPITVFPHLYRIWGSVRSKQLLHELDKVCPTMLLGNRPSCHAMQLWTYVQWIIELSHVTGQAIAGISADIQKAFNHLPREVVLAAAVAIGFPPQVLIAWASALGHMTRRFQIRKDLGPPVLSRTGCPEGCSMSCIGMMLIDFLFHHWFSSQYPLARPLSYVDDWKIVTSSPSDISELHVALQTFTSHVDLLLDPKKTYSWATTTSSRKQLKRQNISQRQQGKSLGAQMQYTKKHGAAVVHDRIAELVPLWMKLRSSLSPYPLKVRVLSRAAWPKGLHGIAATNIGQSAFVHLRSGAMRGINADGAGRSPWVHLGLVESTESDPQFFAVIETFRSVRMCHSEDSVATLMDTAINNPEVLPTGGPTHALVNRLQWIGWTVLGGAKIRDTWGDFSIFDISFQELRLRAQMSWQKVVASKVGARPLFEGLEHVDVYNTRRFLAMLPPQDQALMRKALNGASFTKTCAVTSMRQAQRHVCFVEPRTPDFTDFGNARFLRRNEKNASRHWCLTFICYQGVSLRRVGFFDLRPQTGGGTCCKPRKCRIVCIPLHMATRLLDGVMFLQMGAVCSPPNLHIGLHLGQCV